MSGARTPFIKICGMTTAAAVSTSLSCDVNAIGFVFATSIRALTTQKASELAAGARGRIACVAVTRHPTRDQVREILRDFKPDILQTDIDDIAGLDLPSTLSVLPVMRPAPHATCTLPGRVLFEGPVSGSGQTTDWDAARQLSGSCELILAGGLNPVNVGIAIRQVRPFGVDVSSGVEDSPGIKSAEKIEKFVAAARAASLELNS